MKPQALIAVALGFALITLAPIAVPGAEQFSREVGLPMKEAQTAIGKKQWESALASIHKAQAVTGKNAYEEYQINEMLAYVYNQKGDFAAAARAYEANLASGRVPESQMAPHLAAVARMYAGLGKWAKVIEFANRWSKASPGDAAAYQQVAQAQFQLKSYQGALRSIDQALELEDKPGKKPNEQWLLFKLSCQHALDDKAGMAETQQELALHYPSRDNWKAVLVKVEDHFRSLPSNDTRDLNLLRLMRELDLLHKPEHYEELAQIAIDNGTPREAVGVIQQGMANKKLAGKDGARFVRLLDNAKKRVQEAETQIAALDKAARAAATGEKDVALGDRYLSAGDYQKAVDAIQRGLKKGGLKGTDEAQLLLGRAYLKLKQKDKARKAFGTIPDDSRFAQVAQLWGMYAGQS